MLYSRPWANSSTRAFFSKEWAMACSTAWRSWPGSVTLKMPRLPERSVGLTMTG